MVSTFCVVAETRNDTTIDTSPATPAPATRNKFRTKNLGSAQFRNSNFNGHFPTAALSPEAAQIVSAS